MIDNQVIQQLSVKNQARPINILREYYQHLFLSYFYAQAGTDAFLFKGGTALRIAYNSARFSEDIDFSGVKNGQKYETILEKVIEQINQEGIDCQPEESKATSGGWLAILSLTALGQNLTIRNKISFRKKQITGINEVIASDFIPSYRIILLNPQSLVEEKIRALLARKKPRDIFDLYFICRHPYLRQQLELENKTRKQIISFLQTLKPKQIEADLKPLLPISFLSVLKDLPQRLIKELS